MSDETRSLGVTVRPAVADDFAIIIRLIHALADYEKLARPDAAAAERLRHDMFGPRPRIEPYLAEIGGAAVGYALCFETYSSFLALPTLFLEDLFVLSEYRGRKVGRTLFAAMVSEAHRRGCGRLEWTVLDWNRLAIDFYLRAGGSHMKEWQLFRLIRPDMERLLERQG
jgi:GNAT superfamily N-acetyltransferase